MTAHCVSWCGRRRRRPRRRSAARRALCRPASLAACGIHVAAQGSSAPITPRQTSLDFGSPLSICSAIFFLSPRPPPFALLWTATKQLCPPSWVKVETNGIQSQLTAARSRSPYWRQPTRFLVKMSQHALPNARLCLLETSMLMLPRSAMANKNVWSLAVPVQPATSRLQARSVTRSGRTRRNHALKASR